MEQFLLGKYIPWISSGFLALILLFAAWRYFTGGRFLKYKTLIKSVIWFRVLYAIFLTASQYYLWSKGALSKFLLEMPLSESLPIPLVQAFPEVFSSKAGYFIFYSWGHFFLNLFLSLFLAWLFYKFLLLLKKYQERFFEEGETKLGFICALVAGWPGIAVFIPLAFALIIIFSIIRIIALRESYTTLGAPFLIAAAAALWVSPLILSLFNLKLHV